MELRGLEPLTPCLQSRCATNCATAPVMHPAVPEGQTWSEAFAHASSGWAGFWADFDLLTAQATPAAAATRTRIFFM